jgi:hypothetical protein
MPTGTAARARSLIPLKNPQPPMTKPDEHHHDGSHTEPERVRAVAQTPATPPDRSTDRVTMDSRLHQLDLRVARPIQ